MQKGFNNLKISSIINFILAALLCSIFPKYSIALVIIGFITLYFTTFNINQLNLSKGWLIFMGILLIFVNFISGIFVLIGYDCIQAYLKENKDQLEEKEKVDQEVKKIDLLLKLGIGMVTISAILFATSTWNAISNLVKLILLLSLGTLFFGLSIFSQKKLKLKQTAWTYWLLGCIFYLFTWIIVCHYEYFGSLFSYTSSLFDLAYLTTYLIGTILLFITYKKFNKNNLLYLIYMGVYLSIYHFLRYIGIHVMIVILIITIINILCNLLSKKESDTSLFKISKLVSYLIIIPILDNYHTYSSIFTLIIAAASIINLGIISIKTNDFISNLCIPIISYIYVYIGFSNLQLEHYSNLLFAGIFSIISIFLHFTKENKKGYITINHLIYHIGMLIFYFNSVDNDLELILVNIIYLVTTLINSIQKKNSNKESINKFLHPIPITLLALSICEIIDTNWIEISVMMSFSIISVVYGLISTISKDKNQRIYNILFLLSIIFNLLINLIELEFIASIILLFCSTYLFIKNYLSKQNNKFIGILSYVILLLNIYHTATLIHIDVLSNYKEVISTVITIIIYSILLLFLRKKSPYGAITNITLIIPMCNLIESYVIEYNLSLVIENIVQFYILYLLIKFLCKSTSSKNILTILGTIFIIIQVIFEKGIYTGIYIGIVGIIVIILGYLDKTNKSLFNIGIVITIFNIIYQLQNLWEIVPFWLYLLLVGLGLIIFVTYKETKKLNIKKD